MLWSHNKYHHFLFRGLCMLTTKKIKEGLYLNILPIKVSETVEKISIASAVEDQFLIFDRSGSMYGYIDSIVEEAKQYVQKLADGSRVHIGYFSGTGQYALSIPYTLQKEANGAVNLLNTYKSTLGMTNFIEILSQVNKVASGVNKKCSLFFFTDGCHNSGGSSSDVIKALVEWKKYASVSTFVGYGYIDRDMMTAMAKAVDGSFIHLSSFKEFGSTLFDFGSCVAETTPSIDVDLSEYPGIIPVAISSSSIIEYTMDGNNHIAYKPINRKKFNDIYFLTTFVPANAELDDKPIDGESSWYRAAMAVAYIYSQKTDVPTALDLAVATQDKAVVDNLYFGIAPDEFAKTENLMRQAVFKPAKRFTAGISAKSYLPDDSALCVMDFLNDLVSCSEAKIYPWDEFFEYNRIGSETQGKDGAKIQYPKDFSADVHSIVMNQTRLNVGISVEAMASVELDPSKFSTGFTDKDLESLGIAKTYPVSVYRTYNIIADGRLNVSNVVVSGVSADVLNKYFDHLQKHPKDEGKFIVRLSELPILNKLYVKNTSARYLADNVWKEKILMDTSSTYNYILGQVEELSGTAGKVIAASKSDEARLQFLQDKCFIKNGAYNPPVTVVKGDDVYEAYEFKIGIDGYSKISAGPIVKKLREGKKATPREKTIADVYTKFVSDYGDFAESKNFAKHIEFLKKELVKTKQDLFSVRKNIQGCKLAIILGNRGKMNEFTSRENMQLSNVPVEFPDGSKSEVSFTFEIGKIEVKI